MKTLKILRVFFRLKKEEFIEMKVKMWALILMLSIFAIILISNIEFLKKILIFIAPFVWGIWLLYGLFLFIRFLRLNWQKAKKEVEG